MASLLSTAGTGAAIASAGSNIIGALNATSAIGPSLPTTSTGSNLPWNSGTPVNSAFFLAMSPDYTLWDKLLPYRLVVVDVNNNNQVVGGNFPTDVGIQPVGNGTLSFYPMGTAWEFFLPITPQQLSIVDNYAINTTATLKGIIEEHSGIRFKNINIQGTFGVWTQRASAVTPPSGSTSALQSIFGGTIAAAQNVASQFQSVINAATTGTAASKPTTVTPGSSGDSDGGLSTGYYQTILFQQFLEQYAEAKKNPANSGWRLVFDIPKQNQSFVVTPVAFNWHENVNRPMEINYTLQMKAWRRIDINSLSYDQASTVTPLTPGILQRVLNTIQAAQNTAAASYNLIGSVRSDVDNVLNVIRQTGLFVKGISGVAVAASDLPSNLISDAQSTITGFLSTLSPNGLAGTAATDSKTIALITALHTSYGQREGLSTQAVSNGQLGASVASAQTIDPANNIFIKPQTYPILFGQVPVSNLTLNANQQAAYENEIDSVNAFTVSDLKTMRGVINTLCGQLANSFGAGNAYYSTLYNKPVPTVRSTPMTMDEYDILQSFYDLLQSYDILTATNQLNNNNDTLTNMEYVSGLAADSGIEFSIPNSKVQVPVPFGLTMEGIALRYFGDTDRWIEIATLNNLREPYIDETGFTYSLLSNGDGRNVVVGDNTSLYIGQIISINSSTQSPTSRTILGITTLSQTSYLLTLDGEANLDIYTSNDNAYMKAYLPGTTNSQKVIFIPSTLQTPADDGISIPTSVANVNLVGLSKVDLLVNDNGDIAINNYGDFRLSAGLTNLLQALRIKFGTIKGTVYSHPTFGLGTKVGSMNADFKAKDLYNDINQLVTEDPRFSNLSGIQVALNGPTLAISLGVGLAGQKGVYPISFTLPTS